ncbi:MULTISPECIES: hypothetical protein [Streptomyces]|uniref:Knr4/Smi1-like domain-containing protein n=1 Tax=Streptomyces lienomycini TaxID=284035 RepID=A0ABV9X775_9ACTN|nr:hypothetical protein [Streptomyces sp. NBC_00334]
MSDPQDLEGVWKRLTAWLKVNAPLSHASLLPGAPEVVIEGADAALRHDLGFPLPAELAALWRLCGGVEHQEIEGDEEGEVGSGAFLPGGVIMSPVDALRPRLPDRTSTDWWGGAPVVPWLTRDEAGPESGHWVGDIGVGRWYLDSLIDVGQKAAYPSIAAYLDAGYRTLTDGPADAMALGVPGVVWGCLVWERPETPSLDEALPHWTPVH